MLGKIAEYLNNEQKNQLFKKLSTATVFTSNKDYQRELSLIEIITIQKYGDELNSLMSETWIPQFNSRFTNENYFNFVVPAVHLVRDFVHQETIDSYVEVALSKFSSQPKSSLNAINQVSAKISNAEFEKVFDKITISTPASEFDLALDIIINNDNVRPTGSTELTAYSNFLIKNLPTANDPNRALGVINRSFDWISQSKEMVQNALKSKACDHAILNNVTGKFLNNSESPESAADTIIEICMLENAENVIVQAFSKINRLNLSDIFRQIVTKAEDTLTPTATTNLLKLACSNLNIDTASQLLIRCLEISFFQVNQTEINIEHVRTIRNHATQLSKSSKNFVPILISGFTSTTSDNLKINILELVCSLKIKAPFKKELTGDDLEFYNKEIG